MRLRAASVALALVALPWSLAGCVGCPAALLEGDLVREGATLVVETGSGDTTAVQWPFGYGVREDGDSLVVTDLFGAIKAREGDHVRLGGGMVGENEEAFGVCGDYEVEPAG